jgi:hypothetical protein
MSGLSPISFEFVAAGVARRARVALARLVPSRVNKEAPSWEGHGGAPEGAEVATPITERTFWESRYVLTELTLCKEDGETLVVNDAVVTVTQEKHIVRPTPAGPIRKYLCNGDYDISISVGIVAVDSDGQIVDEYPEEGIRKVKEFLDENKAVEVMSVFLSIFGIGRMVVTRFSLKQETASNRQTIEVRALSDEDYVIKSTEY